MASSRPENGDKIFPPRHVAWSMIPKKPAPDLIRGGHRFSEKIMLKQGKGQQDFAAQSRTVRGATAAQCGRFVAIGLTCPATGIA
jgi:hypothetical protein